jgi:NADPH2 dehydrogenase
MNVKSASDLAFEGGPKLKPMTKEKIWEYVRIYK